MPLNMDHFKEKLENYSRVKEAKKTWQLSAMHDLEFYFARKDIIKAIGEIWVRFIDQIHNGIILIFWFW